MDAVRLLGAKEIIGIQLVYFLHITSDGQDGFVGQVNVTVSLSKESLQLPNCPLVAVEVYVDEVASLATAVEPLAFFSIFHRCLYPARRGALGLNEIHRWAEGCGGYYFFRYGVRFNIF